MKYYLKRSSSRTSTVGSRQYCTDSFCINPAGFTVHETRTRRLCENCFRNLRRLICLESLGSRSSTVPSHHTSSGFLTGIPLFQPIRWLPPPLAVLVGFSLVQYAFGAPLGCSSLHQALTLLASRLLVSSCRGRECCHRCLAQRRRSAQSYPNTSRRTAGRARRMLTLMDLLLLERRELRRSLLQQQQCKKK